MSVNTEAIEGTLEKLVFSSPAGDFVVARLNVKGRREPITIVGPLPKPYPGEILVLSGNWVMDKKFGEQFRFISAHTKAPSTIDAIQKYLSSNLIKGIGPDTARRITAVFGTETLNVIENQPEKLLSVPNIGKVRAASISEAFREQKNIREVMLFLQSHGVSTTYAVKIFKRFGKNSIDVVTANPYILASEIRGIGFKSADKIAGTLGIDLRSPIRIKAGMMHVLDEIETEGHVYCRMAQLIDRSSGLLGLDAKLISPALDSLASSRDVIIDEDRVYKSIMYFHEKSVAEKVNLLRTSPHFLPSIKTDAAFEWLKKRLGVDLSHAQKEAVTAALESKVLVITGGPGTGKTTLLKALILILEAKKISHVLAAPTGRAAKRLSEATGREAKTIHRLLEYSPGSGGFQRGPDRPLETDFIIIDEVSMVDIALMNNLLRAINIHATVILVGDSDQLPSVGPGKVLEDLIESEKLPVVRLGTIFRQAQSSLIITNAHLVNTGIIPIKSGENPGMKQDCFLIEKEDPEECLQLIKEMVGSRIPRRFGYDPLNDVQILCPMHRGILGTENLNREIREILNSRGLQIRGDRFRVGDRVMQVKNDYDKAVFNGDIGMISSYDEESEEVEIRYEDRLVTYHISELDEITPAYAVTIHKSQGSEYRAVIIPLATQHFVMLRRNLLYTAMTRGRELVIIIGSSKALQIAVENKYTEPRFSWLAQRI